METKKKKNNPKIYRFGRFVVENNFQTLPFHVLLYILEFRPKLMVKISTFPQDLFGYFQYDPSRKIFMIFRNLQVKPDLFDKNVLLKRAKSITVCHETVTYLNNRSVPTKEVRKSRLPKNLDHVVFVSFGSLLLSPPKTVTSLHYSFFPPPLTPGNLLGNLLKPSLFFDQSMNIISRESISTIGLVVSCSTYGAFSFSSFTKLKKFFYAEILMDEILSNLPKSLEVLILTNSKKKKVMTFKCGLQNLSNLRKLVLKNEESILNTIRRRGEGVDPEIYIEKSFVDSIPFDNLERLSLDEGCCLIQSLEKDSLDGTDLLETIQKKGTSLKRLDLIAIFGLEHSSFAHLWSRTGKGLPSNLERFEFILFNRFTGGTNDAMPISLLECMRNLLPEKITTLNCEFDGVPRDSKMELQDFSQIIPNSVEYLHLCASQPTTIDPIWWNEEEATRNLWPEKLRRLELSVSMKTFDRDAMNQMFDGLQNLKFLNGLCLNYEPSSTDSSVVVLSKMKSFIRDNICKLSQLESLLLRGWNLGMSILSKSYIPKAKLRELELECQSESKEEVMKEIASLQNFEKLEMLVLRISTRFPEIQNMGLTSEDIFYQEQIERAELKLKLEGELISKKLVDPSCITKVFVVSL